MKAGDGALAMAPKKLTDGLTVITTHINTDFDAVASVLAAQKLYPGSMVVLPGSNEKNLRNFFISSMAYLFNMRDIREVDFGSVQRLVLVDTRQKKRIGDLAAVLKNPDLEIHVYDHHPPSEDDVNADVLVYEEIGATVSILTEKIRQENLPLSPDEATVMCLGIYEDTGGFTFVSTTPRDFEAAGFLLSRGANLTTVANMISRELTPEQVEILNKMIKNSWRRTINDIEVVISSISTTAYVPDFAFLVHKMQKMENLTVLFAVAEMSGKIYIVGRSRTRAVDVGSVLGLFGGGGHAYAASASTRDMTLAQVEQELVEILSRQAQTRVRAADIMSSPVIAATAEITCRQAADMLTRYNINTLLITEKAEARGTILGFISRQVIEKALYHRLGEAPVSDYMTTDFSRVSPDDVLLDVQEKIIENNQRLLPVVAGERLQGVITRTDLLNVLVAGRNGEMDREPEPIEGSRYPKTRKIQKILQERLSQRVYDILQTAGRTAAEIGCQAYVVGGFVRDLFLYRHTEDVDIVIEGDGILFAEKFSAVMGARFHYYRKFGTAVITLPDGAKVDVASARLEYYQFPAALPTVEMSSIKLDLFRRDFTVNTLAVCLNPEKFGTLIDFFSAQRDIKERTIRVLHNLSFVEDPTRVFRAVKFEQRFGFTIGRMTAGLIENAVKKDFFKRLSGYRVFGEVAQILEEDNPVPAMERLAQYKLLQAVHPAITMNKKKVADLNSVREVVGWYDLLFFEDNYTRWAVYFLALMQGVETDTAADICRRFEMSSRYRRLLGPERLRAEGILNRLQRSVPVKNSILYDWLHGLQTELVLYIMAVAANDEVRKHISRYILQLKGVRPLIKGADLKRMGIAPSPVYSRILAAVRDARLDGRVITRSDELEFVKQYVQQH